MNNNEIYERITSTIVSALEQGTVPWHRPWSSDYAGLQQNLISHKPYRGVNQFLCELQAMAHGYTSPYWLTMKQANLKKGKIRKGEKGTMVVFWKPFKVKTDEIKDGQAVIKTIPLLRYYYVWNIEQIDGIEIPKTEKVEFNQIAEAQRIIDEMPSAPPITHGGDRAFYSPLTDSVTLPPQAAFKRPEDYYGTAYHELVHSTGHQDRLGRVANWASFGSEPYGQEELVAELGAAMLSGVVGLNVTHEQSAAYCQSWIRTIKGEPKLIIQAASKAQKAADYILGHSYSEEQE